MSLHTLMLALAAAALIFAPTFAQDDAAAAPAAEAGEETAPAEPVKCPIGGGGFQELYAVSMLLTNQDKLLEAEVCLSDAITSTMPAFKLLADIATSKGERGRSWKIAELMDTVMNNGNSKLYLVRKLLQLGDGAEKAEPMLAELMEVETNKDNAELQHLTSVTQFKLDKIDDAIESMKKAVKLDPESELYPSELEVLEKAKNGELPEEDTK